MKHSWIFILLVALLASRCATQTTPMGGPKDTIPPTIIKYSPGENQANFDGKEVTVTFNEAIQLNNPKDEIIIVPSTGKKTEFKLKGNSLIITPELPWKDSTTYNISFREGVKDLTEGTPAVDFRTDGPPHLAFSTGPIIDTLSISGTVKSALIEAIPENITIAIYKSDTFNIFDDTPEYFTKSNKEGYFILTNLKSDTYRIYAFEDKNKNLKAESRTEKFGFLSTPIKLDSAVRGLEIPLVNVDTRQPKITSSRNQSTTNILRFNKAINEYQITSDLKFQTHFSSNQTEIIAHYPKIDIDSTLIQLKAIDSTQQIIDTLIYIKRDSRGKIKETFTVASGEASYNIETNALQYSVTFNKPIASLNKDSIYIQHDSITRTRLPIKKFLMDTILQRITINEFVPIDSLPKSPAITIGKGFLISIDGDTSKRAQPSLRTFDAKTTAVLTVKVQTNEPHFVIQVINSSNKVVQSVRNQKTVKFKYLTPETVKIRAIIDMNNNGVWDTAIYPQNREPEKIVYYRNFKNTSEVPLRANWDVDDLVIKF